MGPATGSGFNGTGIIKNATVPACLLADMQGADPTSLLAMDLKVVDGKLLEVAPGGSMTGVEPGLDLDKGLVLPAFVDLHTHLDKGHIWPRKANPDGSFMGALTAVGEDRIDYWSADDLRARMEFSLKCAYAHGTAAIRTHLDSIPPQEDITWPVFEEMRAEWRGRITLQGVCLFGIDRLAEDGDYLSDIADKVSNANGIMGAVTYMIPDLDRHLEDVFRAAMDRGLDLDFHVDETLDPAVVTLRHIAETAQRLKFDGKIVCGHCCSLSVHQPDEIDRTLDLLAETGIAIVSLPMCNMYLQDRVEGRTPRRRGVTLLHEMKQRGISVAVASDNTRDPFYAYGDLDMVEVYTQATRILHLDHPIGDWISTVTTTPAQLMDIRAGQLEIGAPADLVLFGARDWNELLSRPAGPRSVLRAGTLIDQTLPDYRELDQILQERQPKS
ncbi:cytosine deaminase [Roseibium porphyridii]|uniref:Cytosine deaminase n=1 Tax=Roseibium porphyridii TaxID=2866279 RepID=A0ABY8F292_9HYPH|nr:cytosine deaminase [Roseibium sp. KMA01]WFE89602.1 cytosine deaminase [Roseibium sp. KMA01]